MSLIILGRSHPERRANVYWAEFEVPAAAAGTSVSSSRPARITGTATANSNRPARITGQATASESRAARITGQAVASENRTAKITGTATASENRPARISGALAASEARPARITGQATASENRTAKVVGQLIASEARTAKVVGTATTSEARTAKVTGQATANDNRAARVVGQETASEARTAKITGQATASEVRTTQIVGASAAAVTSDRPARITGQDTASDNRPARVTGQDTASDSRTSKITGTATASDSRDARVTGQLTASDNRPARVTGQATATDTRTTNVTGQLTVSDSRTAQIVGALGANDSRNARIVGTATASDSRTAKIAGQFIASESRDARITGTATATDSRAARVTAQLTASDSRATRVVGTATASDSRAAKTIGTATTSDTRNARITGALDATDSRAARVTGTATANDTRSARVTGQATSSDARTAKIVGTPILQYARPASDISTGTWTATPLYAKIDEVIASDADSIQSASSPATSDIAEVKLSSLNDPGVNTDHVIRYRIGKSADTDNLTLTVRLVQGTTVIASWEHINVPYAMQTIEQTLTTGEAGAITDYTDLRLRFEAVQTPSERAPFASTSVYNKTLDQRYPSGIPIHVNSDLQIEAIRRTVTFPGPGETGTIQTGPGTRPQMFTSDVLQFTLPVYIVTEDTPLATVRYSGARAEASDASTTRYTGGGTITVPVDPSWKPAPPNINNDANSDSQMIIWDRDNVLGNGGEFWDFWQCAQEITGDINVAGEWKQNGSGEYTCVNCSHFTGEIASSGVPSNSPHAYVSRGAGVPYIAGLVRKWELEAAAADEGHIEHVIAFAYSSPDNTFTPPASKSDGSGIDSTQAGSGNPYSGPEGAFLKLSDDFDVDSLPTAEARAIARTLQMYGMVAIDNTGRPKVFLEADVSADWATVPSSQLLGYIPIEAFQVVDWTGTGGGTANQWSAALASTGIAGTPAILGTVTGSSAGSSATVVSASQTPNQNELVLAIVAEKGIENEHVTSVSGNGMSSGWQDGEYRSYTHYGIWTSGQRNQWLEIQAARVPSGTSAGAVTVTSTNSAVDATKALQVIRLTANAKPIKFAVDDCGATDTNNPVVTIKNPQSGSLLLGIVAHRNGTVSSVNSGWTSNTLNTAGGTTAHVSTWTQTSTGADVTLSANLSGSTEWVAMIVEIT